VNDGGTKRQFPLDQPMSQRGSVTYVRQSGDVEVRLTLYDGSRHLANEMVRFAGTAPQQQPAATLATVADTGELSQLQTQRDRLQQALNQQQERNRSLREALARTR
jgi:hypothetical protein